MQTAPETLRPFSGRLALIGRYYDPETAQFISVDPEVSRTGQPYAYAGDDPANNSDPTGALCWGWSCWGSGYAAAWNHPLETAGLAVGAAFAAVAIVATGGLAAAAFADYGFTVAGFYTAAIYVGAGSTFEAGDAIAGDELAAESAATPDVGAAAQDHAEQLLDIGNAPRAAAAAYDTEAGGMYFGESGSVPSAIEPELAEQMPNPSLEDWPAGNCAEFNACNTALANGAKLQNLVYATFKINEGAGTVEPFPPCRNCVAALAGAKSWFG